MQLEDTEMPLGQIPQNWWSMCIEGLKLITRLPIIALVIVAAAMLSWVGFWFIIRLTLYVYEHWLKNPW